MKEIMPQILSPLVNLYVFKINNERKAGRRVIPDISDHIITQNICCLFSDWRFFD